MRLKNFIVIVIIVLFGEHANSQVRSTDLKNQYGDAYEYSKGPAYYNDSLYTGGGEVYYSDAVLWSKTSYVDGKPNGYEIFYYETGTPWCIGLRDKREKQGEWIFYKRNGEIQGVEVFKGGFRISEPLELEEQPGE